MKKRTRCVAVSLALVAMLMLGALVSCAGSGGKAEEVDSSSEVPSKRQSQGSTKLAGKWEAYGKDDIRNVLEFVEDGRARWILGTADEGKDVTLYVYYSLDESKNPMHLDLWGFTSGPFKGLTLYGICDMFGKDHFRVDFEMGASEQEGASARPTKFGADTMEYDRVP